MQGLVVPVVTQNTVPDWCMLPSRISAKHVDVVYSAKGSDFSDIDRIFKNKIPSYSLQMVILNFQCFSFCENEFHNMICVDHLQIFEKDSWQILPCFRCFRIIFKMVTTRLYFL